MTARSGGSIRVLHVDDERDFTDRMATYLAEEMIVETATSVGEALDRLDDGVDCVVSDYDLPDADGLGFLETVREEYPDLPFVLFTGEGSEEIASAAISAGVTDYLRKRDVTNQSELLANRIEEVVTRTRTRRGGGDGKRRERTADQEVEPNRLQTLEALRERVAFALDATDSILFELDLEAGTETRWGPFERLFGTAPDRVETSEAFYERCVHPDDRDRLRELQDPDELEASETVQCEFRTHPDRGEVRWIQFEAYATTDADGRPERLVGLDTDVTDRKEREERLDLYRTMVETVPDAVYAQGADRRFVAVNEGMADLTGYTKDELIGSPVSLVLDDEELETAKANRQKLRETDTEFLVHEFEIQTADGDLIPVENRFRVLPSDDEFRGTAGVIRDVSEHKEREARLQRQNERLDEFATLVSHDLRNPLNVAQGRLELATEECNSEHLASATDAIRRSQALIDDLLTLAREGESATEKRTVELAELVDSCWHNVETDDATLGIETERAIRADPDRLKQLLENLVRNAVEHGGENVTVTVGDLDDGFYVADDGPGVPEDERERVFESGYSTAREGTGFGLSIVEEIVEAHGWEIAVTESDSGGARFEIKNPTEGRV